MKRGAENYITKDDGPHDDLEEEGSGEGFQKAEGAVLATRIIRGLPKRATGSPAPLPSTNGNGMTDAPSTNFSGFSGFGSSSNSFPFTPPTPSSILPSTSPRPVSSGPSFLFPPNPPAVASTASNTAKSFASFIADSSSSRPATTPPESPPPSIAEQGDVEDKAAVKYFTSLRGLNVSFLAALSLAVEKDPFTDVTTVFDRYKSLRSTVQTEFDIRPSASIPTASAAPDPKPSSTQAPPAFSGFGSFGSNSSAATGSTLPKSSPFTSSSGFSFPPPLSTASSGPSVTTTGSSTLFKTSGSSISGTSPFGSSSTFSSNSTVFGSSAPTSTLFGNDKPVNSPSLFGAPPSSSTKPNPFGSSVGFGKPTGGGGSLGNPVGFGFGGPSGTPESDADGSMGSKSGGSPDTAETKNSESTEVTPQPDGERRDDVAAPGLLGTNPHDEEGEGEEQEDTIYSVKLRAFRLKKAEEKGGAGWAELGYGVLRLKKHKETDARRMLLRNSSTGKININFNLYSGLRPSQTKKAITFIGHDTGVSQTYSVRLQTEEHATKLKEALEKEILLVKNSTDTMS